MKSKKSQIIRTAWALSSLRKLLHRFSFGAVFANECPYVSIPRRGLISRVEFRDKQILMNCVARDDHRSERVYASYSTWQPRARTLEVGLLAIGVLSRNAHR
ncbi:MAG TPA: hypothetical protein DDW52_12810 [Planctomycetaceae bacterium]|nr:hypothetical protein [Planctomycetaceae bacterium]